jgi:hypothetical protein
MGIYKNWDETQRDYFDNGCEMLIKWKDFFLSYTNRNYHQTNNQFKKIIRPELDPEIYNANKNKSNCVAHLLCEYLGTQGLNCFFAPKNLSCGDILEEEIFKYCKSVYVFVQLVELKTMSYPEDGINWCFNEYEEFDGWINGNDAGRCPRYRFVITVKEENVYPKRLHGSYKKWQKKIKERLFINNLEKSSVNQFRDRMAELAESIIKTRNLMLEAYYS